MARELTPAFTVMADYKRAIGRTVANRKADCGRQAWPALQGFA